MSVVTEARDGLTGGDRRPRTRRFERQGPPLAPWLRVLVFLVGWLLVLVGIAGLVLPGIQGVLTLVIGAALLSLVSEIAYELLRRSLGRWPKLWKRVTTWRRRMRQVLVRWSSR